MAAVAGHRENSPQDGGAHVPLVYLEARNGVRSGIAFGRVLDRVRFLRLTGFGHYDAKMRKALLVIALVSQAAAVVQADGLASDRAATASRSFAAEVESDLVSRLASSVVKRLRRGIAIGPFVGGVVGRDFALQGSTVAGIAYGIGLYTFRYPSILDLPRLVSERLQQRVLDRVKAIVASGGTPPDDLGAIAREVADDVYRELFGDLNPRKLLAKPGFGALLEGISRFEPGDTQLRLGLSYGVGPVSLGGGTGVRLGGGSVSGFAGLELSLRLTPWGDFRTPVLDIHSRFDVGFAGDDSRTLLIGTRLLLDLL